MCMARGSRWSQAEREAVSRCPRRGVSHSTSGAHMRLSVKALTIAVAITWGAGVLLVGIGHLIWPTYGTAFLEMMASIYPGYEVGGFGSVIVGTLYALFDGAICGAVVAWLYNMFAAPPAAA